MSQENYTAKILGMEDIEVEKIECIDNQQRISFHLPRRQLECPECGCMTDKVHDYRVRTLHDLPLQGQALILFYKRRRYMCPMCGKRFPEPFSLAGTKQQMTARLVIHALDMSKERRSETSIAKELGVSVSTAIRWLKYLPQSKPSELPEVLSIDEFRGNAGGERFQCILAAPVKKELVDILPNRSSTTIIDYLKSFENRSSVKYWIMDMNRPYLEIAKTFLPNAKIVIDRFHFVRYCVEAFEKVRKRVQKEISAQKRRYFKRSRKLLIKRAADLSVEDAQAVNVMLAQSEDLSEAWSLKEEFYSFLDSKNSIEARNRLDKFSYFVKSLKLKEFKSFLKTLKNWEEYILNAFDCPYSNGYTEGMNNATKVLKRVTFGMPNFINFRIRILNCASIHP